MHLPGFGRSKLDVRDVANNFASAPRAAVFGIDLRCHGDRALDASGVCKEERSAAEIAALADATSNGNPERTGGDGIPDNSGAGFFPGDPRALRDGQIASIIEVIHIVQTFQRGAMAVAASGIQASGTDVHLLAHGHSTAVAIAAAGLTRAPVRTVSLASGGAGIPRLVLDGPAPLREAFLASAPAGVSASNLQPYLQRLEATVLAGVDFAEAAARARERYIRAAGGSPRVLLAHGGRAEFVSLGARQALITALGLDQVDERVSAHHGECDDFFLHTCKLGDNAAWGERARDQLGTFVSSNGVTVLAPAQ